MAIDIQAILRKVVAERNDADRQIEIKDVPKEEPVQVEVPVEVTYTVTMEKPKMAHRHYINFTKMFNTVVTPKIDDFSSQLRTLATCLAKEEEQKLKEAFKQSFDELNIAIENKLVERKKTLRDKQEFEKMVAENEANLAWLKNFKTRLNESLAN